MKCDSFSDKIRRNSLVGSLALGMHRFFIRQRTISESNTLLEPEISSNLVSQFISSGLSILRCTTQLSSCGEAVERCWANNKPKTIQFESFNSEQHYFLAVNDKEQFFQLNFFLMCFLYCIWNYLFKLHK